MWNNIYWAYSVALVAVNADNVFAVLFYSWLKLSHTFSQSSA